MMEPNPPPGTRQERGFQLRVAPEGDTGYRLELHQARAGNSSSGSEGFVLLARIKGEPLKAIIDQVLAALRKGG